MKEGNQTEQINNIIKKQSLINYIIVAYTNHAIEVIPFYYNIFDLEEN